MAVGTAAHSMKRVWLIDPQAIKDNTLSVGSVGSTPASCDCRGWNYAILEIRIGATDIAPTLMNWYESDDDSTYAEIDGLDWIADTTSEPSATDDNKTYSCFVDLRKRKRYIQCEFKYGDGTVGGYAVALVSLFDPDEVPNTAAERGLAAQIIL